MAILLEIVLPVFGVVAFGYAATYTRIFDENAARGLSAFVFWFAIPVLLFRSTATATLSIGAALPYLVAYYGTTAFVMALRMFLAPGSSLNRRVILGFGAGYSNTVLLGIPLVLTALGPNATLPLFLLIAFHGLIFLTAITVLSELARGERESLREVPRRTLVGIVTNPIVIGLLLGLTVSFSGAKLPPVLDRFAELIGRAAVPCALFSMGASLREYRIVGALAPAMVNVGLKLVLHPLLVAAIVYGLLDLPKLWAATAVLCASLPTGVNSYLFAMRYQVAEAESATTILLSSLLSLPTVTVMLWLVTS